MSDVANYTGDNQVSIVSGGGGGGGQRHLPSPLGTVSCRQPDGYYFIHRWMR